MYPPFIEDFEWDELPQPRNPKSVLPIDHDELDNFDEEAEFGFVLGNE